MLKTGLIADAALYHRLIHVADVLSDSGLLEEAMKRRVEIKEEIVEQDPLEKGRAKS